MPFLHKRKEKPKIIENQTKKKCFVSKHIGNDIIYDGNWDWKKKKRQGYGSVRKLLPNGQFKRIYIGQWVADQKQGEGLKYYNNGIYFGFWNANKRHGLGIMWYNGSDAMYIGEWKYDTYNGVGVLFQRNGNRYEGNFLNGLKHGEGIFYHNHTGQLQKGIWGKGNCITSIMQDEIRQTADKPTIYPIWRNEISNINRVVHNSFRRFMIDIQDICSCGSLDLLSCRDIRFINPEHLMEMPEN